MALLKFTRDNFENEALNSEIPVLIDFYAEWCGPCRMLGPVIDEIAEETTTFKVGKVNIDNEIALTMKYSVLYRTDLAYSVGVMPNFSLNCREKW